MLVTYYRFVISKSRNQSKGDIFANIDGTVMNHLNQLLGVQPPELAARCTTT